MAIKRLRSSTLAINKYNPSITKPSGSAYWLMIGVPNRVVSATRIKDKKRLCWIKCNDHVEGLSSKSCNTHSGKFPFFATMRKNEVTYHFLDHGR